MANVNLAELYQFSYDNALYNIARFGVNRHQNQPQTAREYTEETRRNQRMAHAIALDTVLHVDRMAERRKTAKAVYTSKTTQTGQNGTDTECQTTSRPGMQLPVTGSLEDDASAEPRRFVPAGSEQCMYDVD